MSKRKTTEALNKQVHITMKGMLDLLFTLRGGPLDEADAAMKLHDTSNELAGYLLRNGHASLREAIKGYFEVEKTSDIDDEFAYKLLEELFGTVIWVEYENS